MSQENDLKGTDEAMLAALMNRGRDRSVLSAEQEKMLDDWVADLLPQAAVERAEALVRDNVLAAERVLEHRLMSAASQEPTIPASLSARILKMASTPPAKRSGFRWPVLKTWRWSGLAGAMATVMAVVVLGVQQFISDPPIQVAMANVSDRGVLFEAADVRVRGAQQPSVSERRFRDVELPTDVVKELTETNNARAQRAAVQKLLLLIVGSNEAGTTPPAVVVDAALSQKIGTGSDRKKFIVRVYNLEDTRAADVRSKLEPPPPVGRAYFVTAKP